MAVKRKVKQPRGKDQPGALIPPKRGGGTIGVTIPLYLPIVPAAPYSVRIKKTEVRSARINGKVSTKQTSVRRRSKDDDDDGGYEPPPDPHDGPQMPYYVLVELTIGEDPAS